MTSPVLVVVAGKDDRPPGLPPAGEPTRFTFAWDLAGVRRALPEAEVVLLAEYAMALMLAAAKDLPGTRAVARHAAAFGMEVTAVGRHARGGDADFQRVVGRDELTDALAEADYVVLTIPLTPESRGMLGREALAAMRPTARLVNLARGAVLDQQALVKLFLENLDRWSRGAPLRNVVDKHLGFVPS